MPTEVFTNKALTTVSSGGTTAPAAGTIETWTVASSSTFPAASNTSSPATQFSVVDLAAQTELVRVTNVSGTTWTVTRGVEGTTPVAHTTGFTIVHTVTARSITAVAGQNLQANRVPLRRWAAALADVANNPVDVLCIGDSITEGSNSTDTSLRWVELMRDQLRALMPVPGVGGGQNYSPVLYDTPTLTDAGTVSGTPTRTYYGLGARSYDLTTVTPTVTFTVFGTSAKVFFRRPAAAVTASYSVDGATAVNFSAGGATAGSGFDDLNSATITFTTRGSHTVALKYVSGGTFSLEGLAVFDGDEATGIRIWESGYYGANTADVTTYMADGTWHFGDYITRIQPSLVILQFGTNDCTTSGSGGATGNLPSATYKTNMQSIIAAIKAACTITPSIVLMAMYRPNVTFWEPWGNYVQALYDIAAADSSCIVLDLTGRFPPVSGDVQGLYSDGIHPSAKGQIDIGNTVANFLTDDERAASTLQRRSSRLTAAVTSTSVTYAATGLAHQLAANTAYVFRAGGQYRTAATTTGIGLRMNGTATVTAIRHSINIWGAATNASTPTVVTASALTTANLTANVVAATTDYLWQIEGVIRVGATGGDLRIEMASEVAASTATLQSDSFFTVEPG